MHVNKYYKRNIARNDPQNLFLNLNVDAAYTAKHIGGTMPTATASGQGLLLATSPNRKIQRLGLCALKFRYNSSINQQAEIALNGVGRAAGRAARRILAFRGGLGHAKRSQNTILELIKQGDTDT